VNSNPPAQNGNVPSSIDIFKFGAGMTYYPHGLDKDNLGTMTRFSHNFTISNVTLDYSHFGNVG
jgi:hypothetical protein